jgi:hypothetical protein
VATYAPCVVTQTGLFYAHPAPGILVRPERWQALRIYRKREMICPAA